MNTRHYRRISRKSAEQLLDGTAGFAPDCPDRLVSLLAAAAAPGREHELAGEELAVTAFEANHLAPDASTRSEQMLKSPLARILTTKIIAAALLVTASGGVALAASTGTFSGSAPNSGGNSAPAPALTPPAPGSQASPASSPSTYVFPTASASASPSSSAAPSSTASPAASAAATAPAGTVPQGATALCRALISEAAGTGSQTLSQAQQVQALASSALPGALGGSEFTTLISTAQSATAVPDYCALVLDLPQLPQPGDLTQLPVMVLAKLLTQLPAAALAQDLTSLPSSTLSALLAELPAATVSSIVTELPSSVVSQLLTALPSSVVTQVLTELPASALSGVLSGLPSSLLSGLPTSLLSGL